MTPRPAYSVLRRSARGRLLAGVCAGLAPYLDVHPAIVRAAFLFLALVGGIGIVLYVVTWLVVPLRLPHSRAPIERANNVEAGHLVAGGLLLAVGGLLLIRRLVPASESTFWPMIAIAVGIATLLVIARWDE